MQKKILGVILLFIGVFSFINVYAANYELRELIPKNIPTTIVTKHFSYKNFSYNNGIIKFDKIKNLSDQELPITISVALFDKDKKNIGIVNYCSKKNINPAASDAVIKSKQERSYEIMVDNYLAKDKTADDIKYIAVLSDNINCTTSGSQSYVGKYIDDIGVVKNDNVDKQTKLLVTMLVIIGGVILLIFLYQFMFTNSYTNVDGDDVRRGYKKYNKELKEKREIESLEEEPEEKPISEKPIEILEQEEEASKEDKSGTDLHDLYK